MKIRNYIMVGLILAVLLCTGCDRGLEFVEMEIVKFPDSIVYCVGQSTELNLSGGEVKLTIREGSDYIFEMTETEFEITHSIDFGTKGVYVVEVRRTPKLYAKFPIQVISIDEECD